ncbi:MAG: hypothetical protein ACT4OM_12110 [Actinomycetota bacterium]
MSEPVDPVELAVAAYLEQQELGGPAPDFSALDQRTRGRVDQIIAMLALTDGVALRCAMPSGHEARPPSRRTARLLIRSTESEPGRALLGRLDDALSAGEPVDIDPAPTCFAFDDLPVIGAWTIGTVGGRVRIWLVDTASAQDLEQDLHHLESLDKVFRACSETAAICLTARDLNCLLLEPQDCAPVIEVPTGSPGTRRYRRPIQPLSDAVSTFLRELLPPWEALPSFVADQQQTIDVAAIAAGAAAGAVEAQRAGGARSRYPKKEVLTALGDREAHALTAIAIALYEGRQSGSEVEAQLRRLTASS